MVSLFFLITQGSKHSQLLSVHYQSFLFLTFTVVHIHEHNHAARSFVLCQLLILVSVVDRSLVGG